jgi:hypothetical protein
MDFPVYMATVNEQDTDSGISFVSLVDKPAIKKDFLAFANHQKYAIQSEDKRIITGPAMIADLPIYRKDDERGEYYIVFSAETIWSLAKKFSREQKYSAVNVMHKDEVDSLSMMELYFINRERGINPPTGFEDVTDGSWFMSYLVDNDEVWAKVKAGEFKGFSVEGFFGIENQNLTAAKALLSEIENFRNSVK